MVVGFFFGDLHRLNEVTYCFVQRVTIKLCAFLEVHDKP